MRSNPDSLIDPALEGGEVQDVFLLDHDALVDRSTSQQKRTASEVQHPLSQNASPTFVMYVPHLPGLT